MVTHGYWCNAKTYKMKCKYCGKTIFYFSCDCGCRVFFDELGEPWPIHDCIQYRKAKQAELFSTALKTLNLNDLLFQGEECEIDTDYSGKIKNNIHRKIEDFKILRADAEQITINDIGYLREKKSRINLFSSYNEETTEINLNTLKGFNYNHLSKITIITGDIHKENQKSYTGFIESNKVKYLEKGQLVEFQLSGINIFFDKLIWLFDWIDIIDFHEICDIKHKNKVRI